MSPAREALLALEDGSLWPGCSQGAPGEATGEIVFNTSLAGYQEILTDPSYHRQIVTFTTAHIGNTGIVPEDDESDRIWAAAMICRDMSAVASSWRARRSLTAWLRDHGIVALSDVDTRALVRHIREQGAMRAALGSDGSEPDRLVALARSCPTMTGLDLTGEVTCTKPYEWTEGAPWWRPPANSDAPAGDPRENDVRGGRPSDAPTTGDAGTAAASSGRDKPLHVVAYDFGIKRNILRQIALRGCRISVVPAATPARDVLALAPDGVFLSNGPGDPAAATGPIEAVRALLGKVPIFGICLGHQILALALGGSTYKLKFGHRGGNQPVRAIAGGVVEISAHNHGFAVAGESLPATAVATLVNLNDGCCEGLEAPALRAFSVQFHPESAPGPHDSAGHFDRFVSLMGEAI